MLFDMISNKLHRVLHFKNDLSLRIISSRTCLNSFSTYKIDSKDNVEGAYFKPHWIPFSIAKHGDFLQEKPKLDNTYLSDFPLRRFLQFNVPNEVLREIEVDLQRFGCRIVNEIDDLGRKCEEQLPHLSVQNAWCQRTDELLTCDAWKQQHNISAEEGLVSIAYERKLNEWSRLHQVCKLYLYGPSAGLYSCPLAMTDGAARTIEAVGTKHPLINKAFECLTTRDPVKFWTSGQWMTERQGGSDVANGTETIAVLDGNFHRLYGYKWFTSATDSNMALTLARCLDINGKAIQGAKGLNLFYLETRNSNGALNNIQLVKLKNKLGTRQVPTAELLLDGAIAYNMSEEGQGISSISHMLNITRLHNAISAVAGMRRILMLARDYSQKRIAFGQAIGKFPLHMQVLSRMEVEVRGSLLLLLKVATWLGKSELGVASAEESLLLRLMSPILKLYTAKQAVSVVSEGLEAFGGQGYIEDTGLPAMLRDAQVLPIWEGTTNIMSLDVLRSFVKTNFEVLSVFEKHIAACVEIGQRNPTLALSCSKVQNSTKFILDFVKNFPNLLNVAARDLAYSIARTYIGVLLIENALLSSHREDFISAQRWCELQDLCPLSTQHNFSSYTDKASDDLKIVMEGYHTT